MDRYEEEALEEAERNYAWRAKVYQDEIAKLRKDLRRAKQDVRLAWCAALTALLSAILLAASHVHATPFTLFVDGYRSVEGELVPLGGPTRTPTPVPTLSPTPQTPATPGKCSGLSLDGRLGLREPPVYGIVGQRWAAGSETRYCLRELGQRSWRRLTFTITRQCGDAIVPILKVTEPNGKEWTTTRVVRFQPSDPGTYSVRVVGGAGFCFGSVEVEGES